MGLVGSRLMLRHVEDDEVCCLLLVYVFCVTDVEVYSEIGGLALVHVQRYFTIAI